MSSQKRLRVSYVIPPPSESAPRLRLPNLGTPRNGATGPIIIPYVGSHVQPEEFPSAKTPKHRLGVVCLALDQTTRSQGQSEPQGILYSGGRDGQILSHDLHLPMRRRTSDSRQFTCSWESRTGWDDDTSDEGLEDRDGPTFLDGSAEARASVTSTLAYEFDPNSFTSGQVSDKIRS